MTRMRPLLRAVSLLAIAAAAVHAQQDPPRRLDFSRETGAEPVAQDTLRRTTPEMRSAFVRNQTILGLAVYGPAFATMVGSEPATRIAGYMVMAGGTFFAANEAARQWEITPARQVLSSRMAWRGTGAGLLLANAAHIREGEAGAMTLIGGLGGAGTGLAVGSGLTEGEAQAMVVGHDIAAASALALMYIIDPYDSDGTGTSPQLRVLIPTASGMFGYALGRLYAGRAAYEVTAGDALLLWLGAGIGATAASTAIAESTPGAQAVAGTVLVGGLAGVWGADRLLVRRYDHSRADGAFVSLGGGAGALMGIGIGVLISGEAERSSAPTLAFAALGATAGVWLTERYARPPADQGRRYELGAAAAAADALRPARRADFNPLAALAAASGTPGRHSILRFTF